MKSANRPTSDSLTTLTIGPEFQARCGNETSPLPDTQLPPQGEPPRRYPPNPRCTIRPPAAVLSDRRLHKTRQEVRDIGKDKGDSEPPTEPQPLTDEAGNLVPEQLRRVFEALGEFDAIQREHDALRRRVEKLAETEAGKWLHLVSYTSHIRNARADVKFSRPYALCPYPHKKGKDCEACRELGWVHKSIYDNAPKEW